MPLLVQFYIILLQALIILIYAFFSSVWKGFVLMQLDQPWRKEKCYRASRSLPAPSRSVLFPTKLAISTRDPWLTISVHYFMKGSTTCQWNAPPHLGLGAHKCSSLNVSKHVGNWNNQFSVALKAIGNKISKSNTTRQRQFHRLIAISLESCYCPTSIATFLLKHFRLGRTSQRYLAVDSWVSWLIFRQRRRVIKYHSPTFAFP